jgi:hypothetical protein
MSFYPLHDSSLSNLPYYQYFLSCVFSLSLLSIASAIEWMQINKNAFFSLNHCVRGSLSIVEHNMEHRLSETSGYRVSDLSENCRTL